MFCCSLGHSFIHCSFIHLSIIWGHMVVPMIQLLWIRLLWLLGNKHQLCPCIQFLMVLYPRSEITGSHDKSVLNFWGINSFWAAAPPNIPTRMPGGFSFSAPFSASGVHSERQPFVQMKWENGFSDSEGVSALLGSHMVLWRVWQRASPPVRFANLFFRGTYSWEKGHFLENPEVQTHPDSPGYKPSLSSWHGREKTRRNHLAHIPLMHCLLSCCVLGVFPVHLVGCDFV